MNQNDILITLSHFKKVGNLELYNINLDVIKNRMINNLMFDINHQTFDILIFRSLRPI